MIKESRWEDIGHDDMTAYDHGELVGRYGDNYMKENGTSGMGVVTAIFISCPLPIALQPPPLQKKKKEKKEKKKRMNERIQQIMSD